MSEVIAAIIGVLGTIIISLISVYFGLKYRIGPNQDKLVQTLKDIVAAQDRKLTELQKAVEDGAKQILLLTNEVEELRDLTVSQALQIADFRVKLLGQQHLDGSLLPKGG